MNKIFKVIWNEARNAYVVVSEIAKNHGSKSCSTKKLLAMLIATGVMTCASFDVLAEKPVAATTDESQYVAFKDDSTFLPGGTVKNFGDYEYIYDATNKYWVRKGYVLTVDENGGKNTPLSENAIRADVAYTGTSVPGGILQSVTSTVSASGTVTNMGESLNKITAGSFAGVSHAGGTEVEGSWDYIIKDASWEGKVASSNYKDGYVNLCAGETATAPKGFVNTDSKDLIWDDSRKAYFYKNQRVDYSNMYVINGKLGVFTNADSTKVYTGTVYGKNNEILMTVKDNNFYSYWAAEVTDPSATMATYRVEEYNKNLAKLVENDDALNRNDIKEVTLTKGENSATIGLMRNGDKAVDGAITVTSGGGTGGKDTFVKISNAADTEGKNFATGSKVEAIGSKDATTGIKINGQTYTIKSGSKVSVTQNADEKTTTITVDGTETTITDTDTTYTEGDGIEISDANAISVSKNLTGMQSIKGAGGIINLAGSAITVNETTFNKDGRIQNVANGTETKDAVNFGQLQETNNKVENLTTEVGKGWTVATENGTATKVGAGDTVKFIGDDNIKVSNTGKDVKVELKKNLTDLTSVTTNNAYVNNVDASKNKSVTNVEYVKNQIADAALSAGNGISITDKKINVKLKDGEENLKVDETGLYLRKDLTGMGSITGVGDGKISFATGGNVTINNITFNNDGRIQGIEAGEDDNDAVNVGQLNKVVAAGDTDVHIQAGNYTVDKNNKVSMNLVDKAGNNEGTVTITGVAKAEDVAVVYDANGSLKSTNAKSVESNAIALGKGASAVKDSVAIGNGASVVVGSNGVSGVALGNKAHAGYKGTSLGSNAISGREGTTLVGANTNSGSLYTTVVGTDSVISSDGTEYKILSKTINVQGAMATAYGAYNNVVNNNKKVFSGVSNSVIGSVNTVKNSNGVTIQGTGNTVTDAYKDMEITYEDLLKFKDGNYSSLGEKESGAVAVVGGANTVSKQTDSTVIGYDNRLIGGEENISHDVFMAGSHNTLTNVSDSIVMGNENAITGVSNVISFGHQNTISANNAVAIGNGAGVSVEGGVALGVGSVASTDANALGYGAAEGETGIAWKATNGAVSVGSSVEGKKITRQITNVAAGTEDTDAVNVAQLKKVSEAAASASQGWKLKTQNGNASDVKPGATVEFDGDANIQVGNDGNKVSVTLKKQLTGIQSITGAGEGAGSISFATDGIKFNNKVTIDNTGKISGVANGITDNDAVNVSQLNKVSAAAKTEVVKGTNIDSVVASTATDGHTVYTVNAKGTSVSVDGNFNLNTTTDDETNVTNYGISLKDSVTIGGTHAVTINGTDGTVTGLTNTTWNKDSITSGRAATEDQLQAVATEAGKHTTLSNGKNTTVESTVKDGQTDYKVNVAGDLTDITSVANGDSKINLNKDSIIISNGNKYFAITNSGIGMSYIGADYSAKSIMLGENGTTISGGLNVAGSKITGVAAGVADTDAVNVGQLNAAVQAGNTDTHIKAGEYGVGTDNKVNMQLVDKNGKDAGTVTIKDVAKASDVGNVNNIASDIKNQDGSHTTVVDAVNNLNNKLDTKVGDLQYSKVEKGDIADGDSTTTAIGKLDQKLTDVAATAAKHTKVEGGNNITVTNTAKEGEAANYKVELNNDIDVNTVKANSVTTGQTVMDKDGLKVGDKVSVTATAVKVGDTTITDKGLEIKDGPSVTKDGINAGNKKVTGVADGDVKENSKDAINGGQLHQAKADINNRIDGVENQVISNSNRIGQLSSRVNKVGAGAAALAALHPMDFDPDDKLTFSAGYGNYGGENAAAIGAYYRPDEKVMFSVGGTVGNGENMVNAGISFALDRTNHVSNSRTALAREVIDLRGQLAEMGAKMAKMEKAFGMLDESKTKLFPDIPANHWAYEYIAKLAGNGILEGYPDGNFGGDRLMTRYEFAAMLYHAIENGAALEERIIKEFEPELGRIRVDRISGEDGDRNKIERVRVNDTKGERDHYGNKLAK
ncbi:ESPR-type extended signal peptide-containing protein [Phascolarctobacterium succinatutens]|uniref:ESPR-type extended signal peptide-containing protein n=1 Tax=Phascolarctobacterium succinatutens TaxID=626940 RepID=UPI0023F53545|nr:ESPR-type extended signal peptide-containing protein [Phascolarctobacterium succinatutens]